MTKTALLLIDIQQGFDDLAYWGQRNNPAAEVLAAQLLAHARAQGWCVIHVGHDSASPSSPLHPSRAGNVFKPAFAPLPHEHVCRKTVNSAFIGTDLLDYCQQQQIRRLVLAGLTTAHCVSTSTRMAGNYGFETVLVADACAAFDLRAHDGALIPAEQVHYHALAALHGEFAQVLNLAQVLSECSG